MEIDIKLEELRKEWIKRPDKREIILRQVKALRIAQGNKQIKVE